MSFLNISDLRIKPNRSLIKKSKSKIEYFLDYLQNNVSMENILIYLIKSNSFYIQNVSQPLIFQQKQNYLTDINDFETDSYTQKQAQNIILLIYPFAREIEILQRKIFSPNIKFIIFNTTKYLSKKYLFNHISNFKPNRTKKYYKYQNRYSNLYQIFENFQKSITFKQNVNTCKADIPFPSTNMIIIKAHKKCRKTKKTDKTVFLIHDHFSVLISIKKVFVYCNIILNSNNFTDKKMAFRMKYATQKVLTQFDLYQYLIPTEKQQTKEDIKRLHKMAKNKITEIAKILQFKYCDSVDDNQLKNFISEINLFVLLHSSYLADLKKNWKKLVKRFSNIEKMELTSDPTFGQIKQSFEKIKKYNQNAFKKLSKIEKISMTKNVNYVIKAINILYDTLLNEKTYRQIKEIEKLLFTVVFNPIQNDSHLTNVFSVIDMHDSFINSSESIFSLSSSPGSGKTRCAPFFIAIKTIQDCENRPFIIMTQPRYLAIKTKIDDFKKILGNSIKIITNSNKMLSYYERYSNNIKYNFNPKYKQPILGIITSQKLLELIQKVDKMNINICTITRFCLDEIHERTVESDVLCAVLSKRINEMICKKQNFPMQLLMMSATPDWRVYNCFKNVNRYKLPSSYMYPVQSIHKQVDGLENTYPVASSEAMNIIERMAEGSIDRGHILFFIPCNYYMSIAKRELCSSKNEFSVNNCLVKFINNFDSLFEDENAEKFYTNLDNYIEEEKRKSCFYKDFLFVLPIKYISYVTKEQKEICLNPIPNHPNVIKIIMATNSLESSITIDNLAAVIDSGTYVNISFNRMKGLLLQSHEIISAHNQTQRKGRVGRTRSGISVQITSKGKPNPVLLPPQILTMNISYNILLLRKIGYKLEEIDNLPNKIDEKDMEKYISELVSFNALTNETHELTPFGELLIELNSFSPFLSAAILYVSGCNSDDCQIKKFIKYDEEEIDEKVLHISLGIFISSIIDSTISVINSLSVKLRKYFDKRSDIITLLLTILDLALKDKEEILESEAEYGLDSNQIISILCHNQTMIENLFFSKEQLQDNKAYVEEKKRREKFIWKTIYKSLYEYVIKPDFDLYSFIQRFIEETGKNIPGWIELKKVKFENICYYQNNLNFIYGGKSEYLFLNQNVMIPLRPGSVGLDSPSSAIVFSVFINDITKITTGFLIHSINEEEVDFAPHPISVPISKMHNQFSLQLLESYVEDSFIRFENTNTSFYLSKEQVINSEDQECLLISFIPKEESSIQTIYDLIKKIEILIPYTPSTILIKDTELDCVVSLHGNGTTQINSSTHFFDDNDYFAYRVDRETIEYLIENIDQIKKCHETLSIAITGESMSYQLCRNDYTQPNYNPNIHPQTYSSAPFVFNDDPVYHNHIVIVSTNEIQSFENKLIPWICDRGEIFDHEENSFLQSANEIGKNTITFSRSFTRLIFTTKDSILQMKGKAPYSYGIDNIPDVLGPISRMFYLCAYHHIKNDTLISPLTLEGFYYRGKKIKQIPEIQQIEFSIQRYIGNSCYCLDVNDQDQVNFVENNVDNICSSNDVWVYTEEVPVFSVYITVVNKKW